MMRLFAPQNFLIALFMLISGISTSQAASACQEQEVIGQESSANTWFSARRNARAKWVSRVSGDIGRGWNNWSFARKRGYMCWEQGAQKICQAAATPCNGRTKSVSLFPEGNQKARNSKNDSDRDRFARGDNRADDRRDAQRQAERDQGDSRLDKRSVRKIKRENAETESGYFTQTLLDDTSVRRSCNGRSTRISGKLLYDLAQAKRSASTLWSEYVGITKGQQWSAWDIAKRREIKCVPEGLRVKCEVSAIACLSADGAKQPRHVKDVRGNRSGRIALPIKRPDFISFAYDETVSRDPGEYGDGNADESDGKMELPEKRDGFALPWLSNPPASRPEPEEGEEGPFGENRTQREFDISGVQKGDFGQRDNPRFQKHNRRNQQGSLTPALPVKRPRLRQAMRDMTKNKRDGYRFQEDYQHEQLKNSNFAGLTLPQERPKRGRVARSWPEKNKRFSQNFNTDTEGTDEEEDSFGSNATKKPARNKPRPRKTKNWNSDTDDAGDNDQRDRRDVRPNRKLRDKIRDKGRKQSGGRAVRDDNATDRWRRKSSPRKGKNNSNSWNFDTDTDTQERRRSDRNKSGRRRGTEGRNIDINVSRPAVRKSNGKPRAGSNRNRKRPRKNKSRNRKQAQQDWTTDRDSEAKGRRDNRDSKRKQNRGQKRGQKSRDRRDKSKVIGGWTADNEGENRSITRRSGGKGRSVVDSRKFKGRVFGSLGMKRSKINYTSNSGVMTRANTFYGCKAEEVASWGKSQPTKPQARQAAIKSWQKVIYNKLGKNWSDWMKAGSSRVQCGTQKGMKKCVAIANPCGEVALKKVDDFASTARCRIYALKFRGDSSKDLAQAKQNAMNVWEKKVEKKYGSKWSDWFRSMESSINCKKRRGKMSCQAFAIPCSL